MYRHIGVNKDTHKTICDKPQSTALNNWRSLFARHGHGTSAFQFLGFLAQRTSIAAQVAEEIAETTSLDSLLLSYLAADHGSCDYVDRGDKLGKAAQTTAITNSLGVFPEGIAGTEVGDDAQSAVIEAAAYSVLPVATHCKVLIFSVANGDASLNVAKNR